MPFHQTNIPGLILFEPKVFGDDRGHFFESYNAKTFETEGGLNVNFVQDNQAYSTKGVLRGLHYQTGDAAQAKLVRVLHGEVLDVVVDIREGSPTYGHYHKQRLSADNKLQMFVPRGFAHGYVVLSETAVFFYKCDNYYSKANEGGLRFDCPLLKIDWEMNSDELIVAERDRNFPSLGAHLK
jgi:dTDP-4-dehydrorhamnose 3,5-epimerase